MTSLVFLMPPHNDHARILYHAVTCHRTKRLQWSIRQRKMAERGSAAMAKRISICGVALLCVGLLAALGRADIYRWDNGEVIPGTEGIQPGPGVQLDHRVLDHADLSELDLSGANFELSNLTLADLASSTLMAANFTGSVVARASFRDTTSRGFTRAQLESTASYQAKDLHGIQLRTNDLTGWDFSGQNLRSAILADSTMANANLSRAYLTHASLHGATLTNADLSGADLTEAFLWDSILTDANLSGAVLRGADFTDSPSSGLTLSQLRSTASYQARDLRDINLSFVDLTGWDFEGQNLTDANLFYSTLTNANLSGANLTGVSLGSATLTNANVRGAIVKGADFNYTESLSLTQAQLRSTASYEAKDLRGIELASKNLSGWDFKGQNLTGAYFYTARLTNANFSGANLKNASLATNSLASAIFDAGTVYNQWTEFPIGFDPARAGLSLEISVPGDLDADDTFGAADVDILTHKLNIVWGPVPTFWMPVAAFDLNGDGIVDQSDHRYWVKNIKQTWYGDANLDGEFNSADLVEVLAAGEYETGLLLHTSWASGDWNADGEFTSADLIVALADGGYEQGPRPSAAAVPEPSDLLLIAGLLPLCWTWMRRGACAKCLAA
jgi:uncharacterized protein YjbI with pentapeptide repeats